MDQERQHKNLGNRSEAMRDLQRALALCTGEHRRHRAVITKALTRARALPEKKKQ